MPKVRVTKDDILNISFDIDSFHLKMWIFTQGLATLVLNNNLKLTDEQISSLLTNEFKALSLYEKNK